LECLLTPRPDGITVVQPCGRLDLLVAAELKHTLLDLIASGQRRLVVDLDLVAFIDSSGLGTLIAALKAARLDGGDLRIARPGQQTRVVLSLTTLDRILRPYASVEEACTGY